ncbi:hypothetical protein MTR_0050s0150 [Medicago truncatula]|uniref:Uncharacterized protein n=1 Tax=Medicago truncatula TaxID=3880 RepID=A0A072TJJ0_MEDTR|nr:hypothetical protein MTR_0050s0150 [Medicago truncatula]
MMLKLIISFLIPDSKKLCTFPKPASLPKESSFLSHLNTFHLDSGSFSVDHGSLASLQLMYDDSVEIVACIDGKWKKFSSAGLGILAGYVPNLEILSLSRTSVDDTTLLFISMMQEGKSDLASLSLTTTKLFPAK